jgi:predicted small lipoprotein YifL
MKMAQLIGVVCVAALVACGQKGPLVMPDAQKHKRTIPTLPGAPAKPASDNATATPAPTDSTSHP